MSSPGVLPAASAALGAEKTTPIPIESRDEATAGRNEALGGLMDDFLAAPVPSQLAVMESLGFNADAPSTLPARRQAAELALNLIGDPITAELDRHPAALIRLSSQIGFENAEKVQKAAVIAHGEPSFATALTQIQAAGHSPRLEAVIDSLFTGSKAGRSALGEGSPRIAVATPLERKAVMARLSGLGVHVPSDGRSVLRRQDVKDSQVTIRDLRAVDSKGDLGVAGLESLRQSSRWMGLRKIAVDRGDRVVAEVVQLSHNEDMGNAQRRLDELLTAPADEQTTRADSYGSAMANLAMTLHDVYVPEILKHLSKKQLDALASYYHAFLVRHAGAAAELSSMPHPTLVRLHEAAPAIEGLIAAAALSQADPVAAYADYQKALGLVARVGRAKKADELLAEMNTANPARDAQLFPIFDTPAFQSFSTAEQKQWMQGLSLLSNEELSAQSPRLARLLHSADFAKMSAEDRNAAVDRETREDDSVSRGYQDRVDAAVTAFGAQKSLGFAPASNGYVMPRRDELTAIRNELVEWPDKLRALKRQHRDAATAAKEAHQAELGKLPDYAEYVTFKEKLDELDSKIQAQQELRGRARAIIEDWKTTKHTSAWRKNKGIVWLGYEEDRRTAEVDAPRVVRETEDTLIELKAERKSMAEEIATWEAYRARDIDPVEAEFKAAESRRNAEESNELAAHRRRKNEIIRLSQEIIEHAFKSAGQDWALKFLEKSYWTGFNLTNTRVGPYFHQQFLSGYSKLLQAAGETIQKLTTHAPQAGGSYGLLELDAKREQAIARIAVDTALARFGEQTKDGALENARQRSAREAEVWNAVAPEIVRFHTTANSAQFDAGGNLIDR